MRSQEDIAKELREDLETIEFMDVEGLVDDHNDSCDVDSYRENASNNKYFEAQKELGFSDKEMDDWWNVNWC